MTADIESGYGLTPEDVAVTSSRIAAAGAVGVNVEDRGPDGGLRSIAEQADRVRAACSAGIFVKARIDTYLIGLDDPFGETVERCRSFAAAGAECVFVPGLVDREVIAQLVAEIDTPLNVMAGPGAPSVDELVAAGARRISLGTALAESSAYHLIEGAKEFFDRGTYDHLSPKLDYGSVDQLFASD